MVNRDVMNEVESFDMEEPGSFANINGTFFRRGAGEESPTKMNESRVSDIMLDLKVMRMKNTAIESQIEEKAKQLALLESRMDIISHSQLSEERDKSVSEVAPEEEEPIIRTFFTGESPLKTVETQEINIQAEEVNKDLPEEHDVPMKKNDESLILVDSLVKENKSLKGLVNYLLQTKDAQRHSESFLNNQFGQNSFHTRDAEANTLPPTSPNRKKLYARSMTFDMAALPSADSAQIKPINKTMTDIEVFPVIKPIQRKALTRSLTSPQIEELLLDDPPVEEKPAVKENAPATEVSLTVQTNFRTKDAGSSQIEELSPIHPIRSKTQAKNVDSEIVIIQPVQNEIQPASAGSSLAEEASGVQSSHARSQVKKSSKIEDFSPIQTFDSSFRFKHEKNESELFTPTTVAQADNLLNHQESHLSPYTL